MLKADGVSVFESPATLPLFERENVPDTGFDSRYPILGCANPARVGIIRLQRSFKYAEAPKPCKDLHQNISKRLAQCKDLQWFISRKLRLACKAVQPAEQMSTKCWWRDTLGRLQCRPGCPRKSLALAPASYMCSSDGFFNMPSQHQGLNISLADTGT